MRCDAMPQVAQSNFAIFLFRAIEFCASFSHVTRAIVSENVVIHFLYYYSRIAHRRSLRVSCVFCFVLALLAAVFLPQSAGRHFFA